MTTIVNLNKFSFIAGCDEVGRGCLAGPVVACSVSLKKGTQAFLMGQGIADSKTLSPIKRRKILAQLGVSWDIKKEKQLALKTESLAIGLSVISSEIIDRINIAQASLLAMKEAYLMIAHPESCILIDGKQDLGTRIPNDLYSYQKAVIKGDQKYEVIGLASIVAKEFRDELMSDHYGKIYPDFHFCKNKGYPTPEHRLAIMKHGTLPIHRKTFKGVREFVIKKA